MGKYKAKKVGRWTERNMDEALVAVRGCMSLKEAARQFRIPYTSLQNRHMQCMDPAKSRKQKRAGGHTVFNDEQEIELKNRIIKLAQFGHGLTKKDIRKAAYTFSESKDWLTGFLERHPDLAKRKPQGLLQARSDGLNKIDVQNYFYLLEQLLKDLNLFNCPESIYNCDETGFPLNNTAQNHIIAKKGSKQVISKTCVEKGENVTVLACTSPVGNFISPFVIYKGKRSPSKDVQIGFPNGTKVITTESGWKTEDAFLLWLQHFERFRAPVSSVLVLDGHISHKSLRALEFCKEKQIHVICLSSHTTHRLQPLDRSFFKHLKPISVKQVITLSIALFWRVRVQGRSRK
ncbi:hypothetical protein ANN_22684 [Periplaneta americana]|uniref:HTH psq-type domain-containing protein n=1 Tax=Periplaneta americana TaxID=6978 RepID=A0ABQ8S8U1_PERAM|nr:hypothetical protein ANN_22684 [Periplaneta americana]